MRASLSCPKKTALGVEEIRQRSHGLSQRHRTMLLLVDGQRARAELLALAGRAGVDAAVFDELVARGLVDDARASPVPGAKPPSQIARRTIQAPPEAPAPSVPPVMPPVMQPAAPAARVEAYDEQRLLAEARTLLIGSLLVEGPVSDSMTALRVRRARTRDELAALVWDIERRLIRAHRAPESQARLKRARELLGLGNTIVEGEPSDDPGGGHGGS